MEVLRRASIWCAALLIAAAPAAELNEYQVKAAFLYNFAKFVDWPASAFSTPGDPFQVCTLGENLPGGVIEEAMRGKNWNGREIVVRHVSGGAEARSCQILFLGAAELRRFPATVASLGRASTLTVGDSEGFAQKGCAIGFRLESNRVRFDVNVGAATRAQLKISSKLLGLARVVKP